MVSLFAVIIGIFCLTALMPIVSIFLRDTELKRYIFQYKRALAEILSTALNKAITNSFVGLVRNDCKVSKLNMIFNE